MHSSDPIVIENASVLLVLFITEAIIPMHYTHQPTQSMDQRNVHFEIFYFCNFKQCGQNYDYFFIHDSTWCKENGRHKIVI
jgi:hypothetical protein